MHSHLVLYTIIIKLLFIEVYAEEEPKLIISTMIRNKGEYFLSLALGKPSQMVQMRIDQSLPYSWTTHSWYSKEDSLTFVSSSKTALDLGTSSRLPTEEIIDQVLFPTNSCIITNYSFYVVDFEIKQNGPKTGFAFGYKYINPSFSLVHLLKQQGNIDHISYGFNLTSKVKYTIVYGQIIFGGLPQKELEGKQKAKCIVVPKQDDWSCILSEVFINNTNMTDYHYTNQAPVKFQIGEERIIAPSDFLYFLVDTLFKEDIKKNRCIFHNTTTHKYIECSSIILTEKLPKINFRFEDFAISLDLQFSWWRDDFYCELLIQTDREDSKTWTMGSLFMMNKVWLFDYEKSDITIYSDSDIINYNSLLKDPYYDTNIKEYILVFYSICFLIGLTGLVIGIIAKVKLTSKGIRVR